MGTNLYSASGDINNNYNQFGTKIDYYLTQHDNLNFRYSFFQSSDVNPLSPQGASVPGFPVGKDQRAQNFVAQETHTFTPALVGVLRFSFLRNKFLFGQSEVHTTPESLGFQYSPSLPVAEGPPFIQISGYTNIGNPITGPRNTYENLYNYLRIDELGHAAASVQVRRRISASADQCHCRASPPMASLCSHRSR